MAAARAPVPRTTAPVLVTKLGDEGTLSMISEARSAGGFCSERIDVAAKERLERKGVGNRAPGPLKCSYLTTRVATLGRRKGAEKSYVSRRNRQYTVNKHPFLSMK